MQTPGAVLDCPKPSPGGELALRSGPSPFGAAADTSMGKTSHEGKATRLRFAPAQNGVVPTAPRPPSLSSAGSVRKVEGVHEDPDFSAGRLGRVEGVFKNPDFSAGRIDGGQSSEASVKSASTSTAKPSVASSAAAASPSWDSRTSFATVRRRRRHRAASERRPR